MVVRAEWVHNLFGFFCYAIFFSDSLTSVYLCNKYQWFTNGDCGQYRTFFDRNKQGASLETLATIIWICSSGWSEQDILKILQQECDL